MVLPRGLWRSPSATIEMAPRITRNCFCMHSQSGIGSFSGLGQRAVFSGRILANRLETGLEGPGRHSGYRTRTEQK